MRLILPSSVLFLSLIANLWFPSQGIAQSIFPEGFKDIPVSESWGPALGFTFDQAGALYVWRKDGKVYVEKDGERSLLLDISEKVAQWGDFGLLGFALHPNFANNGYFYVFYILNRHYLLYNGTAQYDPSLDPPLQATIGRVSRFTADPASGLLIADPESEHILIGESIDTGIPILHASHGGGAMVFGEDGSLLISVGDGASFEREDYGGDAANANAAQALSDGIITEDEDVGALRAQSIHSLNGKILRINPQSGEGYPSNPFYDAANPRAPQSRIWALGLRQGFNMIHKPFTGDHDLEAGNPGEFLINEVGWAHWEEINLLEKGGQNFGWPIYEGIYTRWQYAGARIPNPATPNPQYGQGGCAQYFYFQDLLKPEDQLIDSVFNSPCAPGLEIPKEYPRFVHTSPLISWSNAVWNTEEQGAYAKVQDSTGIPSAVLLDEPSSPIDAENFNGICSIDGLVYTGTQFPAEYRLNYFFADYSGWIHQATLTPDNELVSIKPFFKDQQGDTFLVDIEVNPIDGCIYYMNYSFNSEIHKICYGGNTPPIASLEVDKIYGPSPLTVQFDGSASIDPDQDSISYLWNFGDGSTSTEISPSHVFTANSNAPQKVEVRLVVTDPAGATHTRYQTLSLNNTPPEVEISSFEDGDWYSITGLTWLPLEAVVSDKEHSGEELRYAWQTFFHHNTHYHPEPIDTAKNTYTVLTTEGCEDEEYWFRIRLSVEDAAGLVTIQESELFPFCGERLTDFDSLSAHQTGLAVTVAWESSRETPNTSYEIQRSGDPVRFKTIGYAEVVAPGTYQFIDRYPKVGLNYYRIKTQASDGLYDYSKADTVTYSPRETEVRVFPNPFTEDLSLYLPNMPEAGAYVVYDLLGRVVKEGQWHANQNSNLKLDLGPALQTGIYLLKVETPSDEYQFTITKQ